MNVLLCKNVRKLGAIGDVVEVKDGYARNYLIPMGLGVKPTKDNLRKVEEEKAHYLEELAKQREGFQLRVKQLEGKEITIFARANAEGHLYGSIGPAQIAAAMTEAGLFVEAQDVVLPHPIRQLDKYDVTIELDEGITAAVHVWVVPIREDGEETPPAAEETPAEEPAAEE